MGSLRKSRELFALVIAVACLAVAANVRAADTPHWWDNPEGYDQWTQTIAGGTASNFGPQTQYVIVRLDIVNEYNENASKYIWVQVEWSVVQGTGQLSTGGTDNLIMWLYDPGQIPPSSSDPYPTPDGSGFLAYEGTFTPEYGFDNGDELSYGPFSPQPAHERIEIRFQVDSNSQIDYRIEVQTLCSFWDFGDAPDATYPSYWANSGASHTVGNIWLGENVNNELDTKQIDADEYDDGITFAGYSSSPTGPFVNPGSFSPGDYAAIDWVANGTISSADTAYLHIWIDWDRSGTWEHPSELVVDTAITATGSGRAVIVTPSWLGGEPLGSTWTRARLDREDVGTQTPTGWANNGEVEDYGDVLVDVELSLFEAIAEEAMVFLRWQTDSETENLGFNVYRAGEENGSYQKINVGLIPGAGTSSETQSYTYEDHDVADGKTYYYKLADVDFRGRMRFHGPVSVTMMGAPTRYALEQNHPNPFNPTTSIGFSLEQDGFVSIKVYNMIGQYVRSLVDETVNAGEHSIIWDGRDDAGELLPTGVYMCIMTVNGYRATRKMAFTK